MANYNSIFGAGLRSRVAVYVPGTMGPADADAAAAAAWADRVAGELSALFGGATIQPASGAWVSADYGLIREAVNIVYAYCRPEDLEKHAEKIRDICVAVRDGMRQEAVSLEVNSTLHFI